MTDNSTSPRALRPRIAKLKTPPRPRHDRLTRAAIANSPNGHVTLPTSPEVTDSDPMAITENYTSASTRKRKSSRLAAAASHRSPAKRLRRTRTPQKANCRSQKVGRVSDPVSQRKEITYQGEDLPYLVWRRVFEFVAAPLYDPNPHDSDVEEAAKSLREASRAGRILYEPALTALYKCPPIANQFEYQRLLSKTRIPVPLIKYRPKIETLRIFVDDILTRKFHGRLLSLKDLVRNLPRLKDLELYHHFDEKPYRELGTTIRWKYPDDLIQAFDPVPGGTQENGDKTTFTFLRSWRWNARLAGDGFSLNKLEAIHHHPSFNGLKKLAFVNYQLPSLSIPLRNRETDEAVEKDKIAVIQLGASINALPELSHLVLDSTTLANGLFLDLLPKSLQHLELNNCWEITTDDFSRYLLTRGRLLQKLTMNHCQSLCLSFLPVLAEACPNLTHLEMDLRYFSHYEQHTDLDPLYDTTLKPGAIPSWPSALQSIVIEYPRFSDLDVAASLCQSLVHSAPDLPDLRALVLRPKLDVGRRERYGFRDHWEAKMKHVFQRRCHVPRPIASQISAKPSLNVSQISAKASLNTPRPSRRSARIAASSPEPSSPETDLDFSRRRSGSRMHKVTRSVESLALRPVVPRADDADDEGGSDDELSSDNSEGGQVDKVERKARNGDFIHGFCDLVDFQIDNQKPREHLYDMADFQDDEPLDVDDDDWNAADDDVFYEAGT